MMAMPSAPPTWRKLFRPPDPTPALSTGTDPIATEVMGDIDIAMPKPPRIIAGSSVQTPAYTPARGPQCTETGVQAGPLVEEQRDPEQRHAATHQPATADAVRLLPRDRGDEDD